MIKKLLTILALLLPLSAFAQTTGQFIPFFRWTNATGTSATTTNFFSTTASSTNLFSSLLTVGGTGLVVDSNRRVGIGTANPSVPLDIQKNQIGSIFFQIGNGVFGNLTVDSQNSPSNRYRIITDNSGAALELVTSGQPLYLSPNNGTGVVQVGNQLLVTSSSTLQNFTGLGATTTSATTTNLYVSSYANFGGSLYGANLSSCNSASSALTWSAGLFGCHTIAGGAGGSGGTWATSSIGLYFLNYPLNNTDVVTIGSTATNTAKFFFDPNISLANILGTASTTNLFVQGSSTLQNFTGVNATTSQATTSSFAISNLTAGKLVQSITGGALVSTSTIGNNQLANSSLTINTSYPLSGGSAVSLGGSLSLTFNGLATTSPWTNGQVAYVNANNKVTSVATSSVTVNSPLTTGGTWGYLVGGSSPTLSCQTASGAQAGCLSSTDWTTFNNKQATISATWPITLSGATVGWGGISTSTIPTQGQLSYWTSTTGALGSVGTSTLTASSPLTGSFIQVGSGGSLGCQTASGSQAGCLSSTDWNTFNNKFGAYDAWTHPSAGVSATTSSMIFTNASSTFTGDLNISGNSTTTSATTSNFAVKNILSKILMTNSIGSLVPATNGTDYSLITALTCSGTDKFSGVTAAGVFTCSADQNTGSGGGNSKFATSSGAWAGIYPNNGVSTNLGIGTTTPVFPLETSSSTMPQFSIDNPNGATNAKHLILSNSGQGQFYIGTSSDTSFTSTSTGFTLDFSKPKSLVIGSSTPTLSAVNGLIVAGSNGTNGTTTISVGKIQFDGYSNTGSRVCAYIVGTSWVISSGACIP